MGGKRCVRRHVSSNEYYMEKLNQLARSCDQEPARLASTLIGLALDSAPFVHSLQKMYNAEGPLWVKVKWEEKQKKFVYLSDNPSYDKRKVRAMKHDPYLHFRRDTRFAVSLTNDDDRKLGLLAASCACKKAELAALILHFSLDSSQIVMQLQELHNVHRHFWVTPVSENGVVSYFRISSC